MSNQSGTLDYVEAPEKVEAPFSVPPDLEVPDHLKEIYKEAHDLLARPAGWTRWTLNRPTKREYKAYCLVGAISAVGGSTEAFSFIVDNILNGTPIPTWNDKPRRKKIHVLNLLEELYGDE